MEKLLPQNIEAECGVLGSIILDPVAIAQVSDFLKPEHFYRDAHRTIYEAILSLYNRNTPADFITLCDELELWNVLDTVGGASYITSLINQVPTSGNVEYYGHIVERTAVLRRLIHAAGQIAALGYEQDAEAVEKAEKLIFDIATQVSTFDLWSGAQVMDEYINWLTVRNEQQNGDEIIGFRTGFEDLDKLLGGLQRQELIIFGGRPGTGKTSWILNVIYNALLRKQKRILIYSLEMNRKSLANRLVSMFTGLNSHYLRTRRLQDDEWELIVKASDFFATNDWHVDETGTLSIPAMRSKCRRYIAEHGGIDLIVVDFLQMMQGSESGKRGYNKAEEVGETSKGLRAIAKEFNVPVLAVSALSRAPEGRANKRPQLSDLFQSSQIESDADVVMFIWRDDSTPGYAYISVEKQRNGPVGEVTLRFNGQRTQFEDLVVTIPSAETLEDAENTDYLEDAEEVV